MPDPIDIAVVGHTNAGKTSLLRTLTRRSTFGEVSDRPGTTRHVEAIDLKIDGARAVRFYDTPGLEDSITLLEYLRGLEDCVTPPDRIRAFLKGPEARGSFEQEAKVLRKMLEVDAAVYVIDTREPVLPKFRSEVEILASCARPVMPVLNFVRHKDSRADEWRGMLSAYNLHAQVLFDAVAPFVGSEQRLYQDLATLLWNRRDELAQVTRYLESQIQERRAAGCQLIAGLLVNCAAMRRTISSEEFGAPARQAAFIRDFKNAVLGHARRCVDELLQVYGFRPEEADVTVQPWVNGRWESDLFNPETLREAGKKLGAGATMGAAFGLAADIALAGLSLGTGTAIGAAVGGLASQGWGHFGRRLINKMRGMHELTLENEVLLVMAGQMLNLLWALEQRGHAAQDKVRGSAELPAPAGERLRFVVKAVQPARSHPSWEAKAGGKLPGDEKRVRLVESVAQSVLEVAKMPAQGGM